jgi:pilus assembly protein Flp/PilA
MNFINKTVSALRKNSKGQDLLEYALLVALIAVIAVGAVSAAGGSVKQIFNDITSELGGTPAE